MSCDVQDAGFWMWRRDDAGCWGVELEVAVHSLPLLQASSEMYAGTRSWEMGQNHKDRWRNEDIKK